jgi:hypothetical protein
LGANKEYALKYQYFTSKNHTLLSSTKCRVGALILISRYICCISLLSVSGERENTYIIDIVKK